MIRKQHLYELCNKYISAVITGQLGLSDLKYKGIFSWNVQFPVQQYEPFIDPPKSISTSYMVGRIEITTREIKSSWQYETCALLALGGHVHKYYFVIPKEAWSQQALKFHFKEYIHEIEKAGLIKLTPKEEMDKEYAEAKKQAIAAAYGADYNHYTKFDMELLKKEIEKFKAEAPKTYLVQGPDGNTHVAQPDAGTQVLNNIFTQINAAKATEIHMGMSAFNQIKKLAEEHFQKTGEFPNPDKFIGLGMKVAIDPGVPDGHVVVHATQPPIQLMPKSKHVKKTVEDYGNSGSALAALVPALNHRGIPCPELANCAGIAHNAPLSDMIIHLNDSHRWPRSATDPNPYNKPNIADWIDEVCLIHGLDQSFHPKEEKKPTVRDSAAKKEKGKIEGASLSHSYVDEPVVIDDEWLDTYYENKKFKKQQAILAEQVEAYKEKLIKGFQKYKFPKLEG